MRHITRVQCKNFLQRLHTKPLSTVYLFLVRHSFNIILQAKTQRLALIRTTTPKLVVSEGESCGLPFRAGEIEADEVGARVYTNGNAFRCWWFVPA